MRPALRLFQAAATAAHTPRLLGMWPTGVTGLGTHPLPRPTLLSIYTATLTKLKELPDNSVYRTATEALVKQRQSIVEAVKPQGWEKYLEDLKKEGSESPPKYDQGFTYHEYEGLDVAFQMQDREGYTPGDEEFAGLKQWKRTRDEALDKLTESRSSDEEGAAVKQEQYDRVVSQVEDYKESTLKEPNLSIEQVQHIEAQIGSGLIEEVIQAAYNEYKLIDVMIQNKVWEPLVEKPVEGQWTYFEREKM